MGRLTATGGAMLAYLCVATVLTAAIVFGYVWSHGYLDQEKLNRMMAIARGTEVAAPVVEQVAKAPEAAEQPSLEDVEKQRAIQSRLIELREQAIAHAIENVRNEQRDLTNKIDDYKRLQQGFEDVLSEKKNEALIAGRQNMQQIWENIQPKQAKQQILQMIDANEQNDVVAILSAIAISKRAKIIGEFKTEEEAKKLEEILRLIRQGVPDTLTIDQTREELKKFTPQQK